VGEGVVCEVDAERSAGEQGGNFVDDLIQGKSLAEVIVHGVEARGSAGGVIGLGEDVKRGLMGHGGASMRLCFDASMRSEWGSRFRFVFLLDLRADG
jgi:hypothetical protein